jgi:anthranilate/para-aminobenzoate synthase component II
MVIAFVTRCHNAVPNFDYSIALLMGDRDFVLSVQWHPEMMVTKSGQMMVLF